MKLRIKDQRRWNIVVLSLGILAFVLIESGAIYVMTHLDKFILTGGK